MLRVRVLLPEVLGELAHGDHAGVQDLGRVAQELVDESAAGGVAFPATRKFGDLPLRPCVLAPGWLHTIWNILSCTILCEACVASGGLLHSSLGIPLCSRPSRRPFALI